MNCNLLAAINITQIVAAGMIERKSGGAIVNMSSIVRKHLQLEKHVCEN
jgi:short-subunit dehydrogenase